MTKKWIIGILFILFIIVISIGIFVFIQIQQMEPEYSGNFNIQGLKSPVTISWDSSGVIHLEGENVEDVIFASGFAEAKERLWQMEMMRRMARGKLSEVFGDTTLQMDKLFLTLGLDTLVEKIYENYSEESKTWLLQYAKGVNAYLRTIQDDLPIEFTLMGMKPEPWVPQDCILQTRVMAWFLNFNWKAEILYWQLYSRLSQSKYQEILPHWKDYPEIISSGQFEEFGKRLLGIDKQIRDLFGFSTNFVGSNNWVISPDRTQTGHAILANDPHLALSLPSIWIEMHMSSPEMNVAGFSLPGTPGIIIGRNPRISWGLTNGMIDDSDYFIEKIDTLRNVYYRDDQKKDLQVQTRQISVKNKEDQFFNVYRTDRGAIFNSIFPKISVDKFLSLKWSGWEKTDNLQTFIKLSRAKNWDDFVDALSHYTLPTQNIVFADKKGNIGYKLAGKIPIRTYKNGLLPVDGSVAANRWKSWTPFEELPEIFNPKRGWIATANNKVMEDYPYYLSFLWEPPCRMVRIKNFLENDSSLKLNSTKLLQSDVLNLMAKGLVPILISEIKISEKTGGLEKDILLLLEKWDFRMHTEKVAPSIYEALQLKLIKNIFLDEMGSTLFDLFVNLPNFYWRIYAQVFKNPNSKWFDDIKTENIETRTDMINKSFKEAIAFLKNTVSSDIEDWQWGEIHQLELKHTLGENKLTREIFNKGPFSVPGSGTTVNVGSYPYKKPFIMNAGASLRFLVDWKLHDAYYSIIPGGNSGNFLSPFYDNQIARWQLGDYKKVKMNQLIYDRKIVLKPVK